MENKDPILEHSNLPENGKRNLNLVKKDRVGKTDVSLRDKRDNILRRKRNKARSLSGEFRRAIITSVDDVAKLVQGCSNPNRGVADQAMFYLRRHLCSKRKLYLDKLLELNIVDVLVSRLVTGETDDIKYNALWALAYITSCGCQDTSFFLRESVISALSSLLCGNNLSLIEQSLLALSNIIAEGPVPREFVLRSNILSTLNQILNQHRSSISVTKNISWILRNICRSKYGDVPIEYIEPILQILDVLIGHNTENVLSDVLWSISYLADSSSDHVSLLIESGIVDKIYMFLGATKKLTVNTLRVIGNISATEDKNIQHLFDNGVFFHLRKYLNTPNKRLRKKVYWILSNFAAGTRSQILTLYSLNIFPQILEDLEEGEFGIRREAFWIISNIVHNSTIKEVQPFLRSNMLCMMRKYLENRDYDMIVAALKVVVALLRLYSAHNNKEYMCQKVCQSGVLDCIKNLQTNTDDSIRFWAIHILENYFPEECEQDVEDKDHEQDVEDRDHEQDAENKDHEQDVEDKDPEQDAGDEEILYNGQSDLSNELNQCGF
ncbi:Importin subunit alpha-3 [Thelohanellus kitauei]|uniref:Importin subunit alpha n=1 Tax=Thelohanellus kitauei TaxID=669202 RepID=A0A0C2IB30_THEKT|nr:Importin subunit alpha-3 [Thelohanellus kitauei]